MKKSTFPQIDNFDEEVVSCLENEWIPAWQDHGIEHLAVAGETLTKFQSRPQPQFVGTIKKSPSNNKGQGKRMYRGAQVRRRWPGEDQQINRFPVLNFVRRGQAEYRLGNYVAQCPQGYFLFIPSGVKQPAGEAPHLEKPRKGKHCEIWRFTSAAYENYVTLSVCYSYENQHRNSGQYYIVGDHRVTQLYLIFSEIIENRPMYYREICQSTLHSFLYAFLREIREGRFYNRGVGNLPRSAQLKDSPIEMAKQYIDRNLNHPLTIDIVARAVFMARSGFTKKFRQETGQTFNQYLTMRRMEQAKYWLSQESCSIEVVSQFVGLKHSRFHQLFQQHFRMTPAEFRKKLEEK